MDASPHARYTDLRDRLAGGIDFLPDKPEEDADSTLRALWFLAAGKRVSAIAAQAGELPALDLAGFETLDALLLQRLDGVPLAYLTGRAHFMGLEMLAAPGALVPRRETELLARTAIECARAIDQPQLRIVDVCTGSGNVALALARELANARVDAADLDQAAVDLARRNAVHLGLDQRTRFECGDLLAPFDREEFRGQVDVLTCNPPYISSAKVGQMAGEISAHEPRLAFDGGPLGVSILMRLLDEAPRLLRDGGWLVFEVGAGQGPSLARRLERHPAYTDVRALSDEAGIVRALCARHHAQANATGVSE